MLIEFLKRTSQVSQDVACFVTQLDDMKIFQTSDWWIEVNILCFHFQIQNIQILAGLISNWKILTCF